MKNESLKIKVKGVVRNHFTDNEKRSIGIWLTPEQVEACENVFANNNYEWHGDSYPIKFDEKTDRPYFKTESKFAVGCEGMPNGYEIDDLGKDSEITAFVILKEGVYKRKKYLSAYLSGIQVHVFEERVDYNPFEDSDFTDI